MATYRVGNHQPQNLYRDDQYIGVMFSAEDAALVVEALHHVERAHGPALPIVAPTLEDADFGQPFRARVGICTCPLNARTCPRHGASRR